MLSLSTIKFVAYAAIVVIFWCGIGEGTLLRQLQCPDTTVVQNFDREQVTFIGSNLKISYGFSASKYEVTQALYINVVYFFSF